MALSFCSNWGAIQHLNPEMNSFPLTQPELTTERLGFHDNRALSDTCIDSLFDTNDQFFYSDNYSHLLPYFSPPSDQYLILPPAESFTPEEFESYLYPKRQKGYEDPYYSDITPSFVNGYAPNPYLVQDFLPELLLPSLDFQTPPVYACGSVESVKKPDGGTLSAQSIAARQRRRKITEKTQELGKLIPGGNKMNTAEMFQGAFKYIKYLQAQVGILEFMASTQENEEQFHTKELQFVSSPTIQEKLYSEEKCLVPKQFVQALANNDEIQSNPLIFKDINQLMIGIDGCYGR